MTRLIMLINNIQFVSHLVRNVSDEMMSELFDVRVFVLSFYCALYKKCQITFVRQSNRTYPRIA